MKLRPPTFPELVNERIKKANSCVCLGLDVDHTKIPACCGAGNLSITERMLEFCKALFDNCHEHLLAVKANAAFFERFGPAGKELLKAIFAYCKLVDPYVLQILDYKRADIGNSNLGYVDEARYFGINAVTINPYFGQEDGLQPFLEQRDFGVIILCRTSNKSASRMQDGMYIPPDILTNTRYDRYAPFPMPYYQFVAHEVAHHWNFNNNCALVVGATVPEQLAAVRKIVGNMPILVPGYGAQGGTAADIAVGLDGEKGGIIVNNSRGLLLAYQNQKFLEKYSGFVGREDLFATATRTAVIEMCDAINTFRPLTKKECSV